jgi:hypothetical protein
MMAAQKGYVSTIEDKMSPSDLGDQNAVSLAFDCLPGLIWQHYLERIDFPVSL